MSPIIKWLLARSQMQKAAVGGMDSAYRYRGPAAGSSAALTQQYNQNKEMAPFNQAGAAVTGFGQGLVQGARNIGGAINNTGAAVGDAVGTAYGALNNKGFKPPSGVPAVSYNTGAGAPAEPVAARPPVATQSGPKPANGWRQATMIPDMSVTSGNGAVSAPKPAAPSTPKPQKPVNATPAAMQSQQEMNPSDRAKAIFAQVNQRRRDAAFGRGTFSSADEKALMDQGNSLLNQSNTMRNAPGYKPDVKSMHPRDQSDRLRIQLNQRRSAAGGEVPQSGQMMSQMNRFNAAADAMPAPKMPGGGLWIPGAPSPRPAGPMPMQRSPIQEPMIAKTSAAYAFGALLGAR